MHGDQYVFVAIEAVDAEERRARRKAEGLGEERARPEQAKSVAERQTSDYTTEPEK